MTIETAYAKLGEAIAQGYGKRTMRQCIQLIGEHRHLDIVDIKLRAETIGHAGMNEVVWEVSP